MSDDEGLFAAAAKGGFPAASASDFVEFGWTDEKDRKMSGRRKKLQRKVKPGSFGERRQGRWRQAAVCRWTCRPL